jgi:hypothetical protein
MATEAVERLRRRLGDPQEARRKLERLDHDLRYLLQHVEEWRQRYPNRWMAVYGGRLAAGADPQEDLLTALGEKGVPLEEAVVFFPSEQRAALIL